MKIRAISSLFVVVTLIPICLAQGGSRGAKNPFNAPDATIHYAPDRMYDLQHVRVDLNVDYPNRTLTAVTVNTLAPLLNGTQRLKFYASDKTLIDSVDVDGRSATYARDNENIWVPIAPAVAGKSMIVTFHYHVKGEAPGWHWIEPRKNDPARLGFWTNGESEDTRGWAITWDYPNDFATSETHTTVPAEWQVIGNGVMASNTVNPGGKTRTVVWRMDQPHATYLISAVGGLFDIKQDNWRGVPLYYVVPKGRGKLIDYSFGHTKDMLSFYSDKLGVKYPWPKYAQDVTYDFPGGQENVSATTLGLFLTDPRDGYYRMDSLNSHEMGHQWFGDYVTCKDWGQIWLNESFATFMQMSYTLHSEGIYSAQRDFEGNSQGYFAESRRYQRPMATNFYQNPGVMFDQHTYPKGGALLISLRKMIGEDAFYTGLHHYLTLHHNSPVETNDLCEAMTDASGINMHPWFDQWIWKPGHPVIDWSWSWDGKQVAVHVKQVQDTSKGVPIYDIPAKVALIYNSGPANVVRAPIHLNAADQTFNIDASSKPDAVVFDPDQDFLREIKQQPWKREELVSVLRFAPNCIDKANALKQVADAKPTDAELNAIVQFLRTDRGTFPAITNDSALASLKNDALKGFFEQELNHENFDRRAEAVTALTALPDAQEEVPRIRGLVNDREPYRVVVAAMRGLAKLDYAGSEALIREQAKTSTNAEVKGAALQTLAEHNAPDAGDLIFGALDENQPDEIQAAGMQALTAYKKDDPRIIPILRAQLKSSNFRAVFGVLQIAGDKKLKALIPDLEDLKKRIPQGAGFVDQTIARINS